MKVYTFDNKVLTHDSKWLKEATPAPQEIIIPPSLIANDAINYDINDIPLNTPFTFSYTSYSGNPSESPTFIQYMMNTSNWSAYEFSEMISLTDKAATFTITDKKNYNNFMIALYKPNGSDPILISNISGYKLSYMG